jgi:hypothetical protein
MKLCFCLVFGFLTFVYTPAIYTQARNEYTEWSIPVNLGPMINSTGNDLAAALSKDGRSLFFTSTRPGVGGEDIWVAQRASRKDAWGQPVNLGATINSDWNERMRSVSSDGRFLLFQSDRPGGMGGSDIWVSTRKRTNDDFGWGAPVNLGPVINTSTNELGASYLFGNEGRNHRLYFSSNRPGGLGGADLYSSEIPNGEVFGPPVNLVQLNSAFNDTCSSISSDGLEIIFTSTRPDPDNAINSADLWRSTRSSVFNSWSPPIKLSGVNVDDFVDAHPSLSFDGRTLIFTSNRPGGLGGPDLYMAVRTRSRDPE